MQSSIPKEGALDIDPDFNAIFLSDDNYEKQPGTKLLLGSYLDTKLYISSSFHSFILL